jgi:hypothetical protein
VNCTGHRINIYDPTGYQLLKSIEPSHFKARIKFDYQQVCNEGILMTMVTRTVVDLPDQQEKTIYIVSAMVREFLPSRKDLSSPGNTVKIKDCKIGCKGLVENS